MYEAAPKGMGVFTNHLTAAHVNAMDNREANQLKAGIKYGMDASNMFIQTEMFSAGLPEELQHRVMESVMTKPLDVYKYAQ